MSSWGKDMFICAYLHQLCSFVSLSSVFLFPIFSQYPMLDSGGARHPRERNSLNSLHIFLFGDMSISIVVLCTHSTCHPSLGTLVVSFVCSSQWVHLCYLTLFTQAHPILANSRPQGKYMHHSHVYEKFLLMYILFARRTHGHEGTFPIFISFALMHIAKIHVTHCYSVMVMLSHASIFHIHMIAYMQGEPMLVTCLSKALLAILYIFI